MNFSPFAVSDAWVSEHALWPCVFVQRDSFCATRCSVSYISFWTSDTTGIGIPWDWCITDEQNIGADSIGKTSNSLGLSELSDLKISFASLDLYSHLFKVIIASKLLLS